MKTRLARTALAGACALASACLLDNVAMADFAMGGDSQQYGDADGAHRPHYRTRPLAELGGSLSGGNSINDKGVVAGFSTLRDGDRRHASVWVGGMLFDIGTLGGANSNVAWPVKNQRGLIAGIAQTADPQPLGERWSCADFFDSDTSTGNICRGFAWENGVMRALPTFGGDNGFATGANDAGQIVGWAENRVFDASCSGTQRLQFRAALWGPRPDGMRELLPYGNDSTSAATAINNKGQVVGISGICEIAVGRQSARHAVMWDRGRVIDLGNIGGDAWNTPMAINSRGDVAGFGNVVANVGSSFRGRAFLYTRQRGMKDLLTLPGHTFSQAFGINDHGQVVGTSCTAGFLVCRAFLYQNGRMHDLNDLATGTAGTLLYAGDIDNDGRITGGALLPDGAAEVAFIAVPRGDDDRDDRSASEPLSQTPRAMAMPFAVRESLMRRRGLTHDVLR